MQTVGPRFSLRINNPVSKWNSTIKEGQVFLIRLSASQEWTAGLSFSRYTRDAACRRELYIYRRLKLTSYGLSFVGRSINAKLSCASLCAAKKYRRITVLLSSYYFYGQTQTRKTNVVLPCNFVAVTLYDEISTCKFLHESKTRTVRTYDSYLFRRFCHKFF